MHPGETIFKQTFECRVRQIDLRSEEHIREFGHLRTGRPEIDNRAHLQMEYVRISAYRMASIVGNGGFVRLVHKEDIITIYEAINQHLVIWTEELKRMPIISPSVPVEDLIMLDNFASAIYPQAVRHFPDGLETPLFAKGLNSGFVSFKLPTFKKKDEVVDDFKAEPVRQTDVAKTLASALNVQTMQDRWRRNGNRT